MVLRLNGTVVRKESTGSKTKISKKPKDETVQVQANQALTQPSYYLRVEQTNEELKTLDDKSLVRLFQQSDKKDSDRIFEILLARYKEFIKLQSEGFHRVYKKVSADEFESEGILAFYKLLKKISIENIDQPEYYIKRSITNSLRNHVRSNTRHNSTVSSNDDSHESPLANIIQSNDLETDLDTDYRLDELKELLGNGDLASLIANQRNYLPVRVIELRYGVDLGTNPTHEVLTVIDIRKRLQRGKISIYTNEQIAMKKLRRLLGVEEAIE